MKNNFFDKKIFFLRPSAIVFIIIITVYSYLSTDVVGENSIIKYTTLVFGLCVSFLEFFMIYSKNLDKVKYKREFLIIVLFFIFLTLSSLVVTLIRGIFTFRTIQELIFLILPAIYAFLIINTLDFKNIKIMMQISCLLSFIFYIISLNMAFKDIINSFFSASFFDSYSALESHIFCGLALSFCMFFIYYKKNTFFKVLSLLFVFMTFKRLFMVIAVILLAISFFPKIKEKKVSNKIFILTIICLIIFFLVYYFAMQPENVIMLEEKFNIDISKITMTRSDRLLQLKQSGFKSYGFGSVTDYMYKYFDGYSLEMDMIKMCIEVGFCTCVFMIISYSFFGKKNVYSFVIMTFHLVNLIVSSSLTGTFTWLIVFMIVCCFDKYRS